MFNTFVKLIILCRPKKEDGCEESDTSDIMTLMDIGLIVIFGLCFPTWDVYSDIGLAITLIQPRCYDPPTAFSYGRRHNHILEGILDGKDS